MNDDINCRRIMGVLRLSGVKHAPKSLATSLYHPTVRMFKV